MGVISFASLKGGVGKTSLSVNIAHAFARRGCETLLIDADPLAHATRFFARGMKSTLPTAEPLAKHLFGLQEAQDGESKSNIGSADTLRLLHKVRENLFILPGGEDYRHFTWGKGARAFSRHFGSFLAELAYCFDHIVIDTAPEYSVVTRSILGGSNLSAVPVDSSAMSLSGLEALVESARHIKGLRWCIARTMLDKRASRVQRMSRDTLEKSRCFSPNRPLSQTLECDQEVDDICPIYLLNTSIPRTEHQNLLSFVGKTAFEYLGSTSLASSYMAMAAELERVLELVDDEVLDDEKGEIRKVS